MGKIKEENKVHIKIRSILFSTQPGWACWRFARQQSLQGSIENKRDALPIILDQDESLKAIKHFLKGKDVGPIKLVLWFHHLQLL